MDSEKQEKPLSINDPEQLELGYQIYLLCMGLSDQLHVDPNRLYTLISDNTMFVFDNIRNTKSDDEFLDGFVETCKVLIAINDLN